MKRFSNFQTGFVLSPLIIIAVLLFLLAGGYLFSIRGNPFAIPGNPLNSSGSNVPCQVTNLEPMYGNKPKCKAHLQADQDFIDSWKKQGIPAEQASNGVAAGGWEFFYNDDYDTAMKRFNQSWLLNDKNWRPFWGFAAVLKQRGDLPEAAVMTNKAFELKVDDPLGVYCDLGYLYGLREDNNRPLAKDEFSDAVLKNLKDNGGGDYKWTECYANWAGIYFVAQNYDKSWEYIKLARKNNNTIDPNLIKALTAKMPEPN